MARPLCDAAPCYGSQPSKQTSNNPFFFPKRKIPHERISGSPRIFINILTLSNFIHQIFIHLVSLSKTKLKIRPHSNLVLSSNQNWNQPKSGNFETQFLCSNLKHGGTYHIIGAREQHHQNISAQSMLVIITFFFSPTIIVNHMAPNQTMAPTHTHIPHTIPSW
jgi:hypothetical protein